MKTALRIFVTLFLFSNQIAFAQFIEYNPTYSDGITNVIQPLSDGSGYITQVGRSSIQKIDPQGNKVWEYHPLLSFPGLYSVIQIHYEVLFDGRVFVSALGFECDICTGSAIAMLDKDGNEIWAKYLVSRDGFNCNGILQILISDDSEILGLGRDSIWQISFDGEVLGRKVHDLPIRTVWQNKDQLFAASDKKLYLISKNGARRDSLDLSDKLVEGIAGDTNLNYLIFEKKIQIIDDFEVLPNELSLASDEKLMNAFFKDNKLYFSGISGDEKLIGSVESNLSNPTFTKWGNNYLAPLDFSILDSTLFVVGYEKAANAHFTPFYKTFSTDFESVPIELDAEITEVTAGSASGKVVTYFSPDSTVSYTNVEWTIKNLQVNIRNAGIETIKYLYLNTLGVYQFGCEERQLIASRLLSNLDLKSGRDTTIIWGDKSGSEMFGTEVPKNASFCFWVSSPDERLDVDNSNDLECGTISIRDATFVKNLLPNSAFKLYPNPASDFLNLELAFGLKNPEIQIVNALGKIIFHKKIEGRAFNTQLNINEYNSGIYFFRLKTEQGNLVKKWIKN